MIFYDRFKHLAFCFLVSGCCRDLSRWQAWDAGKSNGATIGPQRRSTLNPHPSIMWWIIQIYLCFSINAHKIIFIISIHTHTHTFTRDGPSSVLINQYDAHDDEKVGIIQIISHKVIRFRIDEIFHLHVNSLMVLFDDWYHCDDSIPEK